MSTEAFVAPGSGQAERDVPFDGKWNLPVPPSTLRRRAAVRWCARPNAQITRLMFNTFANDGISHGYESFFRGMDRFFRVLWPSAFLFMCIGSFLDFAASPALRFGSTWKDFFASTAENPLIWNAFVSYQLPWVVTMGVLPWLMSAWTWWRREEYLIDTEYPPTFLSTFATNDKEDLCAWWWPKKLPAKAIRRMSYRVMHDATTDDNLALQRQRVTEILTFAERTAFLPHHLAVNELTNMFDGLHGAAEPRLRGTVYGALQALTRAPRLRQRCLAGPRQYLSQLYARYKLWTVGYGDTWPMTVLGVSTTLWMYYSFIRYWQTIFQLAVRDHDLEEAKHACHKAGKIWRYMEQAAEELCSICGDWSGIYFGNINDPAGCITDRLVQPMTSAELVTALQRTTKFGLPTSLDLSNQDWLSWTASDVTAITTLLHGNKIASLVLAQAKAATTNTKQLQAWANLFKMLPLTQLELDQLHLTSAQFHTLFSGFNDKAIHSLQILNQRLAVAEWQAIAASMRTWIHLSELTLRNCDLTAGAMSAVAPGIPDSVTDISLRSNNMVVAAADTALHFLPSKLASIDFSQNDLAGWDLGGLARNVSLYSAMLLNISTTGVTDSSFARFVLAMGDKTRLALDVSANHLSLASTRKLVVAPVWAALTSLRLAYTNQGNYGVLYLGQALVKATQLRNVDVTAVGADQQGMTAFFASLKDSHLTALVAGGNDLVAADSASMATAFTQRALRSVSLASSGLSDIAMSDVLRTWQEANWCVDGLDVSGNVMQANAFAALGNYLKHCMLVKVLLAGYQDLPAHAASDLFAAVKDAGVLHADFSQMGLTADTAGDLGSHLPGSALTGLVVAGNEAMGSDGVARIMTGLVTGLTDADALTGDMPAAMRRFLAHAKAATHLQFLSFGLGDYGADALPAVCRALPGSGLAPENVVLNQIDLCVTSGAKRLQPPLMFFWKGLATVIEALSPYVSWLVAATLFVTMATVVYSERHTLTSSLFNLHKSTHKDDAVSPRGRITQGASAHV